MLISRDVPAPPPPEQVLTEEVLPPGPPVTAVVVPKGAKSTTCPLMAQARLQGVPCVLPDFVIEQLTQCSPRSLEASAI